MKKEYLYIVMLILCIATSMFGITRLLYKAYNTNQNLNVSQAQNIFENETTVTTAVQEEKLSPKATFALEKIYDECNHFDYEEAELPKELVNLTQQEIEDYYDEWEVQDFSSDKLVLCKNVNGYCNEHFVIKLDNDFVTIYRLGTYGDLKEYQKTDIAKDYLPAQDVEKLKEGIMVYGEGKLSSVLEDYE